MLSIDPSSATVLEGMRWGTFSGVRQTIVSLLVVKPEGKKKEKREEKKDEEDAEHAVMRTISFIHAIQRYNIAASKILTKTVVVEGINMALIQEQWCREDRIMGLNISGYTLFSASGIHRLRVCFLVRTVNSWIYRDSLVGTW